MQKILIPISIIFFFGMPATAQTKNVEQVISLQIEALRGGDFITAFDIASPAIQSIFGEPEIFVEMVRRGYPIIGSSSEYRFIEKPTKIKSELQYVQFRDEDGALYWYAYVMIIFEGEWRIDGVIRVETPGLTV